jgi:hypothetical protein
VFDPKSYFIRGKIMPQTQNPPSAQGIVVNPDKTELIDYVYRRCQPTPKSFADLGGIWGVDGAYTWYILRQYGADRGYLVDTNFTEGAKKTARTHRNVQLIEGNFGEKKVADQLGIADAVLLFDILLHQVKPDWNEVLELYSKGTEYFLIFNQQWTASEDTVRLLDLGRDEYFRNIPHGPDHPAYQALFEHMDEIHPQHKRVWRDIHNVWQWGISDHDLQQTLNRLGYKMQYYKNCGRVGSLPNFENHAFVFQKA